jgi:prolyl-tRNA synthetase
MKPGDSAVDEACEKIYRAFEGSGKEVLYDETDNRAGAKFATMDLIGLPIQIIAGPRSIGEGKVEIKYRLTGERSTVSIDEALNLLGAK